MTVGTFSIFFNRLRKSNPKLTWDLGREMKLCLHLHIIFRVLWVFFFFCVCAHIFFLWVKVFGHHFLYKIIEISSFKYAVKFVTQSWRLREHNFRKEIPHTNEEMLVSNSPNPSAINSLQWLIIAKVREYSIVLWTKQSNSKPLPQNFSERKPSTALDLLIQDPITTNAMLLIYTRWEAGPSIQPLEAKIATQVPK